MHITNIALVNAAALATAIKIDDALLEAWGEGCVELYDQIGEWATIVTEEETLLSEALDTLDEGWPGVFAYEVTEEVAVRIRGVLLECGMPSPEQVREWTRELIINFCSYDWAQEVRAAYLAASKVASE